MAIMTLIFCVLFFLYLVFVTMMVYAWYRQMQEVLPHSSNHHHLLSVVIAARNESHTIAYLIDDIKNQSYQNFEVIIVDDHSDDETAKIVDELTADDSRFKLIRSSGIGKKAALSNGIAAAAGNIVVTTDADSRVSKLWLESLLSYFDVNTTKLVFGGVRIEEHDFFSRMQAQEFLSLVGSAAATLWWGYPSMCNGANLAFRRDVFFEVGGYENNLHIPSGDDEFLMHKIFHRYPNGVGFASSQDAIVQTRPSSLRQFLHQRIRWAGKWTYNQSIWSILLAMFIFLFQISVIVLPMVTIAGFVDAYLAAILLLTKAIIEWRFLKSTARFLRVKWNWLVFLVLQIVYPFYVVFIGLISNSVPFEWKGRRLKSFTISTLKK